MPTATALPTATASPLQQEVSATWLPSLQPEQGMSASPDGECKLAPFIAPTMPAKIPGITQLDETSGLHMTGSVQVIDLATYRLTVNGMVDHPLSLSLDDLRCMKKITATSDLTCYGVFSDSGTWSGVPIQAVLEKAGVQADAKMVKFTSGDDYSVKVPIEGALDEKNFLAYEMEGKPLPILHGFPLRAVFPNEPGGQWVKWLVELTVE